MYLLFFIHNINREMYCTRISALDNKSNDMYSNMYEKWAIQVMDVKRFICVYLFERFWKILIEEFDDGIIIWLLTIIMKTYMINGFIYTLRL